MMTATSLMMPPKASQNRPRHRKTLKKLRSPRKPKSSI
nr:MAG TPA: hypothetical protein [Caudoviricetes sp.]